MTLTHLFKAQAIFAWMQAVLLWFAPEMATQGTGWELTPNLQSLGQILSVPMLALGIVSWMAPTWVGDNLKKVGMVLGVYINALFVAVQAFHVSTGAANLDALGMFPTLIFIALFFWKCRAADQQDS